MMRARALACIALEAKEYNRAMELIEIGVEEIKEFFYQVGREDLMGECRELQFLEEWAERIETNKPLTPVDKLRRELSHAVEQEDYERAAKLRDQLRGIAV